MISLSFQRSHVCAYITEVCHFSRLQYKENIHVYRGSSEMTSFDFWKKWQLYDKHVLKLFIFNFFIP